MCLVCCGYFFHILLDIIIHDESKGKNTSAKKKKKKKSFCKDAREKTWSSATKLNVVRHNEAEEYHFNICKVLNKAGCEKTATSSRVSKLDCPLRTYNLVNVATNIGVP